MDETESSKDEQKRKPRYEAPKLIAMGGGPSGEGSVACTSGSGATGACVKGSSAADGAGCSTGTSG